MSESAKRSGRQICEAWARRCLGPGATDVEARDEALRFWEMDQSGGLMHVAAAAMVLRDEGLLPDD